MRLNYILLLLLTLLNAVDYLTTVEIIGENAALEANPFAAYLIERWGLWSVLVLKCIPILMLASLLAVLHYTNRWVTWVLAGVNMVYGFVVARSIFMLIVI